ncbi:MAG: hypothetical protein AXA67_09150 [Methylothermaceae bacteria B42]|nr:MAG: hypothetical protein AXA67_09150 [Methylothermaceae bacteria B42]HHJ39469.1 hypothetical protein [Methylothermaceae bacterium]
MAIRFLYIALGFVFIVAYTLYYKDVEIVNLFSNKGADVGGHSSRANDLKLSEDSKLDYIIKELDAIIKEQKQLRRLVNANSNNIKVLSNLVNGTGTMAHVAQDTDEGIDDVEEDDGTTDLATLESALTNEPVDTQWSKNAAGTIIETFDKILPEGVDVSDIYCQFSFCKIVLESSSNIALDAIIDRFSLQLGWKSDISVHASEKDNGSNISTIYISRDGYNLPGF